MSVLFLILLRILNGTYGKLSGGGGSTTYRQANLYVFDFESTVFINDKQQSATVCHRFVYFKYTLYKQK